MCWRHPRLVLVVVVCLLPMVIHADADQKLLPIEVKFSCPVAELGGTLLLPDARTKVPCVVIVGGSLSSTRDGALARKDAPPRDALKRLAEALARGGVASLRYDKVGQGASKPTSKMTGSYDDEAAIAAAAIQYARSRPEIGKVSVAGESAGAYIACLAAKHGEQADGYVFLGGHCGSSEELYAYNFGRMVEHAEKNAEFKQWAEQNRAVELSLGRGYKTMLALAADSKTPDEELIKKFPGGRVALLRRREELKQPPDEMFKHIQAPALSIAGEKDLNVPASHAARAAAIMKAAGNRAAESVVIPGVDHSFQNAPDDPAVAMRERHDFSSFKREHDPKVYETILGWLKKQ